MHAISFTVQITHFACEYVLLRCLFYVNCCLQNIECAFHAHQQKHTYRPIHENTEIIFLQKAIVVNLLQKTAALLEQNNINRVQNSKHHETHQTHLNPDSSYRKMILTSDCSMISLIKNDQMPWYSHTKSALSSFGLMTYCLIKYLDP
jgi:hypothetical protein